jgi:acetylornithine deacetylase
MEQSLSQHSTSLETLRHEVTLLLKKLIETPSLSREEDQTASLIERFLEEHGISFSRKLNNVWTKNLFYTPGLPALLLNSHHDTVKPNPGYTRNPFQAEENDGRLYGLGSNDAGGALVSLLAAFLYFYDKPGLTYNLIFAATAEEEISGSNGLELILNEFQDLSLAIVGEPTQMQLAVAEKGLLVVDCTAHGVSGHAAREEGENAIYKALKDIEWFSTYRFPRVSPHLGEVKMSVTRIEAGSQHNVVPGSCSFTVDIRITEMYTHEEILDTIRNHVSSEVSPRSMRLKPSSISTNHPLVQAGLKLGRTTYGSPTTSDQALLSIPSLKLGPGDSARSHSADEFIWLREIEEGIDLYIRILTPLLFQKTTCS